MTNNELSAESHRFLDGEELVSPPGAEREPAERFRRAMGIYAGSLRAPGEALDDAVMSRIRETRTQKVGVLKWLLAPQAFRVRPVILALAAALVLVVWDRQSVPVPAPAYTAGPAAPGMVLVRFELLAPEANTVALAGSFNAWSAEAIALVPSSTPGMWTVTLPLALGSHEYLFLVDGQRWIADPSAHAQVDDGFGQTNSVIVVGPRGVVKS
jgi:hypothetical protein